MFFIYKHKIMIERNRSTRRKIKENKWESKLRKLWDSNRLNELALH